MATDADSHGLLRFITCGSVDDGKSTLIGRLLYESDLVFDDQLAALERDSSRVGTQGDDLDVALLLDGLQAEREQGITIDVAHRYFSTARRSFIVADTPGHEQYTRNMVTGASTADLAVVLVDARKGVLTQTRRHSLVVSLLGIRSIVLAVNKMDLVDHAESVFRAIEDDYRDVAARLGVTDVVCIPVSALRGDNVVARSTAMPWYAGPSLLEHLETVRVPEPAATAAFRFPVQWINRPDLDFRGVAGTVVAGGVRVGDAVRVLPSGVDTTVARIVTMDGDLPAAVTGQAVTLVLADDVDTARGDLLVSPADPAGVADQLQAHLVWMHEQPMLPGRPYLFKFATRVVGGSIARPKYRVNVDTQEHVAAAVLELNEIGVVNLNLDRSVAFDPYEQVRDTGSFIVIDRLTNATVGAGMVHFALRRSQNVQWQPVVVDKAARAELNGHGAGLVWFTGLSGAGKSTVADLVEQQLHSMGIRTYLLDGDNVRHGLNKDLGFTAADRVENIRRVGEVAKLMVDAGLVVLASFISPYAAERAMVRDLLEPGEFCEVFVDAPLAEVERRDPKGLYARARRGELANFTGIDAPYERPPAPELQLDTTTMSPHEAAERVVERLRDLGLVR
jgi:bifunctional enzyme CysN/CysC